MIIIKENDLSRLDPGSGDSIEKLLEAYFQHGWVSFAAFVDSQDWSAIRGFEERPELQLPETHKGKLPWDNKEAFVSKRKLLSWIAAETSQTPMTYLEFGVREGVSMRWVTENHAHRKSRFHGFDTFEGLPEDWVPAWGGRTIGNKRERGSMAASVPQFEDRRVYLHKGLIQDTLPPFLRRFRRREKLFVNIDNSEFSKALT